MGVYWSEPTSARRSVESAKRFLLIFKRFRVKVCNAPLQKLRKTRWLYRGLQTNYRAIYTESCRDTEKRKYIKMNNEFLEKCGTRDLSETVTLMRWENSNWTVSIRLLALFSRLKIYSSTEMKVGILLISFPVARLDRDASMIKKITGK